MPRAKIIDDATVRGLMKMPLAVQAFPFLRTPPKLPSAPPCCGRKAVDRVDFNRLKMALAGVAGSDLVLLLRILKWPAARVIYQSGKNTVEVILQP